MILAVSLLDALPSLSTFRGNDNVSFFSVENPVTVNASALHQKPLTVFASKSSYELLKQRGTFLNLDSPILIMLWLRILLKHWDILKGLNIGKFHLFIASKKGSCY